MQVISWIMIPLISAFIGYLTNVVAVRLLFWPYQPVNLLVFTVQGVLPKRQAELAISIGELVEEQLLSLDDLIDKLNTPEIHEKVIISLNKVVRERLTLLLPRFLPAKISERIKDSLEKLLKQETPGLIDQVLVSSKNDFSNDIKISKIIERKINDLNFSDLEKIVREASSSELRFIEILGGILGFIIGLAQVGLLLLFS